ncbi:MAG: reverse transcriptase domain-containing protein, partial [Bacteroidota bacterium]
MRTTAKKYGTQLNLLEVGELDGTDSRLSGSEVHAATRQVSVEWLSDCKRARSSSTELMNQIADLSNLSRACQRVISHGGSGGIDGMSTGDLGRWFANHWRELQSSLLEGSYQPNGLRGVSIPKASGGERQLSIPTVKDRMVQQAILQVLSPRYEPIFSVNSYGFRPGKGAHGALESAGRQIASGKHWVIDLDISKFFDEVNHDRLLWKLSRRIGDRRVLELIHRFLRCGLLGRGLESQRIK